MTMKRLLMIVARHSRFALLLAVAAVLGFAGVGAWSMSRPPSAADITWDQLLPEVAKQEGVGGALGGIIQHGQLAGYQMTKPENVALVTDWVGKRVRLPGYVVPLDFDGSKVTGFLLVPYMGACIHVPPPPPNQIVYVHVKEPIEVDEIFEAVYATGTFEASLMATGLAQVGYRIVDATVEYYEPS